MCACVHVGGGGGVHESRRLFDVPLQRLKRRRKRKALRRNAVVVVSTYSIQKAMRTKIWTIQLQEEPSESTPVTATMDTAYKAPSKVELKHVS